MGGRKRQGPSDAGLRRAEAGAPDARVGLAKARALQGDADAALAILNELLGENPEHSPAWLALGNIHYGLRDYASAASGSSARSMAAKEPMACKK